MGKSKIAIIIDRAVKFWDYCAHGVWSDTRPKFTVNLIKTLNITVKSFFSTDIQSQACAMTYRMLLACVPALALLFAIGRGFGFQNLLQDELYHLFPSQRDAISHALAFVDSYLDQASEGIFIGIGIIFLLYTIISLMSSLEDSFNKIWNVREGRSIWRQITDYTAMLLILPVLMICASGLYMSMSTTIQDYFNFDFITPIISAFLEFGSFIFTCIFFTTVFILFPNTKVKIKNALMAGLFTGIGFTILQWLFVTGQLYVARYNAIYGSFSFLPLFLLWMQLVWVICLSGSLICYASQNIFQFSFTEQISDISRSYKEKVTVALAAAIVQRFTAKLPPLTVHEIIEAYHIPSRLVTNTIDLLTDAGIVSRVVIDQKNQLYGFQPAVETDILTINYLHKKLYEMGSSNFIPHFEKNFPGVIKTLSGVNDAVLGETKDILLSEIKINRDHLTKK